MRTPSPQCGATIWSAQCGRHNMIGTVVATIWAIWQRRAADCTTTPQSPKSEKSPFTSYSHRARYMGGLSGTIAQPNRAQSACQGPGRQPPDLQTTRSPLKSVRCHNPTHTWKRLCNKNVLHTDFAQTNTNVKFWSSLKDYTLVGVSHNHIWATILDVALILGHNTRWHTR